MGVYLVTGGAGFIGSHLADSLLQAGHQVRVIDDFSTGKIENLDPRCDVIRGDVCDVAVVEKAMQGVAGCFHLAAIASVARGNEDWLGTHRVNLGGTITVLDVARRLSNIPVVYASSAAVYGNLPGIADEHAHKAPRTAYGADKLGSELHARAGTLVHGIPTLGFRFFNVFGPRQDPHSPYSGVISIFTQAIGSGRPIHIHGTGDQTRDFIYVADIVAFLRAGMTRLHDGWEGDRENSPAVLNACTGRETSILELAQTVAELFGRDPKLTFAPARAGDIQRSVGAPEAAAAALGITARTSLRDGLSKTLASLRHPARVSA